MNPANPNPANPLRLAREELGFTQAQMGTLVGMSRTSVLRYEQGLYITPTNKYTVAASSALDISEKHLLEDYQFFQIKTRVASSPRLPLFNPPVAKSRLRSEGLHPLETWRLAGGFSQIGFCVAFCCHPAQIAKFEGFRTTTTPSCLVTALYDLSRYEELDQLEGVYRGC